MTRALATLALLLVAACDVPTEAELQERRLRVIKADRASALQRCQATCPKGLLPALVPDRSDNPLCACLPPCAPFAPKAAPGSYGNPKYLEVE